MQAVELRQESASRNNMAQSEEALVTGIVQDHGIGIRLRSPRGIRWGCLPPWLLGQQNKRYRRNDPDQPPGNHSLKSLEDMFFCPRFIAVCDREDIMDIFTLLWFNVSPKKRPLKKSGAFKRYNVMNT